MMKRNEPLWLMIYLPCACALALFAMSLIFHVAGYWVSGGIDIIDLIKDNIYLYSKMAGVGFISGFVLWFFNIR